MMSSNFLTTIKWIKIVLLIHFSFILSMLLQKAESDEDEERKALMDKPGPSSAKEEKDNEAFFKKVHLLI